MLKYFDNEYVYALVIISLWLYFKEPCIVLLNENDSVAVFEDAIFEKPTDFSLIEKDVEEPVINHQIIVYGQLEIPSESFNEYDISP